MKALFWLTAFVVIVGGGMLALVASAVLVLIGVAKHRSGRRRNDARGAQWSATVMIMTGTIGMGASVCATIWLLSVLGFELS